MCGSSARLIRQNWQVRRYGGETLAKSPRIALITNDNLGNFAVATPLMQMLRTRHGGSLHYFGGTRVAELAKASELLTASYPLHGTDPRTTAYYLSDQTYDLVVNVEQTPWAKAAASILAGQDTFVCGPCIGPDGRGDMAFPEDERGALWVDPEWASPTLTNTYPILDSGWIAEIFCRLAYLDGPIPAYRIPIEPVAGDVPEVLVATAASLPDKLWPVDKWIELAKRLAARGSSVGLLGAKPADQGRYWRGADQESRLINSGVHDLRGHFTLPQVVGAISKAKLVVTLDNGILHLACSTRTPTVGLFREGIHRLWAPPVRNLSVLHPMAGDSVCSIDVDLVAECAEKLL